eukprot:1400627-Lingulodinium_polyedra.AAC.1
MVVLTRQGFLCRPQGQGASKSSRRKGIGRGVQQLARLAYVAQRDVARGDLASALTFAPRQT